MPPREGFCCATNRMKCVASPAKVPRDVERLPNQACSVASIDPPAEPQLPFLISKSMLTDVGPVELWATLLRRPSAAANPQSGTGLLQTGRWRKTDSNPRSPVGDSIFAEEASSIPCPL